MSSDIGIAGYWDTSPVQTCKRCLAMFDHVVQCETSETWRQLVLLPADKQQEQAHLEVLHNIVKHSLQVWSRAAECDDAVPVSGSVWCSTVCMSGHWARHQRRFYNNKYKHKRGGVIVFTFIFMLKTSIYRGDARIYLCGVESK